jgi:hypothetical protein
MNTYERFKKYAVPADNLADFLLRYSNPNRCSFGVLDGDRIHS